MCGLCGIAEYSSVNSKRDVQTEDSTATLTAIAVLNNQSAVNYEGCFGSSWGNVLGREDVLGVPHVNCFLVPAFLNRVNDCHSETITVAEVMEGGHRQVAFSAKMIVRATACLAREERRTFRRT